MAHVVGREDADGDGTGSGDGMPDYDVGYRRPPKATRFGLGNKAGKGRPRGSPNIGKLINRIADERVSAQLKGKSVKITRKELILRQLVIRAGQGDPKAVDRLLPLLERHEPLDDSADIPHDVADEELDSIAQYLLYRGDLENRDET